jgi:hypothetical protein
MKTNLKLNIVLGRKCGGRGTRRNFAYITFRFRDICVHSKFLPTINNLNHMIHVTFAFFCQFKFIDYSITAFAVRCYV